MGSQEEKIAEMLNERLSEWKDSQKGQTSGYEYERSFAGMIPEISAEAFKEVTGTELRTRIKKKPCKRATGK